MLSFIYHLHFFLFLFPTTLSWSSFTLPPSSMYISGSLHSSLPPSPPSVRPSHPFPPLSSSSQANPFCDRGCVMAYSPSSSPSSSCSSFYATRASLRCGGGSVRHAARSAHASNKSTSGGSITSSSSSKLMLLLFALSLLDGCLIGV
jgi:hypothetical protein